jgi:hypothetical protein
MPHMYIIPKYLILPMVLIVTIPVIEIKKSTRTITVSGTYLSNVMGAFPISRQWRKHIRNMIFLTRHNQSSLISIR